MRTNASPLEKTPSDTRIGDLVHRDRIDLRHDLLREVTALGAAEARLLETIRHCDVAELWRVDGARNVAEWVSAWTGFSQWKARRVVAAAHALPSLPAISSAHAAGSLCLDKVVELARFARPEDEEDLVRWARRVSAARVRERADEEVGRKLERATDAYESRKLDMHSAEDRWFLEAQLPLEQGAAVEQAIRGLAKKLPAAPPRADESEADHKRRTMAQREADALVQLVTGEATPDVTLVVHAPIERLAADDGAVSFGGGVLHSETVRRLSCDARLQVVLEDGCRKPLGIGKRSHDIPDWLRAAVIHRDGGRCTFPGCGTKTDLVGHHVQHWAREGPTDLDNLVSVCKLHHFYVHEGGWSVTLHGDTPMWFRPSGRIYDPGAPPPRAVPARAAPPPTFAAAAGYSRMFDLLVGERDLPGELEPRNLVAARRRRERDRQELSASLGR
jgi:hypothetical protein